MVNWFFSTSVHSTVQIYYRITEVAVRRGSKVLLICSRTTGNRRDLKGNKIQSEFLGSIKYSLCHNWWLTDFSALQCTVQCRFNLFYLFLMIKRNLLVVPREISAWSIVSFSAFTDYTTRSRVNGIASEGSFKNQNSSY